MEYRAFCRMHPEQVFETRAEYSRALEDLATHQSEQHASGVLELEVDVVDEPGE